MSTIRDLGIKARLVLLATAAMAPLLLLVIGGIVYSYRDALDRAESEVRKTATIAAAHLSDTFQDARARLDIIRNLAEVRQAGGPNCNAFLAALREMNQQFLTIGRTDRAGTIDCHSLVRERRPFSERKLLERTLGLKAGGFALGTFKIGPNSGQPTVIAAVSLAHVDGEATGMIYAALDLHQLLDAVRTLSEDGRRSVALIEANTSRIIARWPAPVAFGLPMPEHPALEMIRRFPGGGVAELVDLDGHPRIFGSAPITGIGTSDLVLLVGESRASVVWAVNERALAYVLLAVLALGLAIAGASWLGSEMQVRPIRRLMRTASRIGAGAFDVRTGVERWQAPEFRELASTLDAMAVKLEEGRVAERAVTASEARYRLLADNTADMITCIASDGRRSFVSGASLDLTGFRPDELQERRPQDSAHPDDVAIVDDLLARLRAGESVPAARYRFRHCEGRYVWVEVSGRQIAGSEDLVLSIRDASHRKAMEDDLQAANLRLASLASTDDLTGLANRRSFNQALSAELARCVRAGVPLGLALVDVDRFKAFNDGYGHQAGDECLKSVAQALERTMRRPGDLVARYGGEEFAAILPDATLSGALSCADAMLRAVRDLDIAHAASEHRRVTVSIGVACLFDPQVDDAASILLRQADQALYGAKARGRDTIEAFSGEVSELIRRLPA